MAHIHTPIPSLKLNDGTSMPMLAYGTGTAWYKHGEESQVDQGVVDGVKTAIKLEYTHLDGADSKFLRFGPGFWRTCQRR
jgi:diketogulonate reductase-like aldo/keto reductase